MSTNVTKGGPSGNDVLALNVLAQRYQQLFVAAAPKNLGINLVALISDRATLRQEEWLACRMYSVGMTVRAMFEYDDFFAEFAPPNMVQYTVAASAHRVSDDLLGQPPSADVNTVYLTTSFFDGVQDPSAAEMMGCAIAGLVLGRIAKAAASYQPTDLNPLTLTSSGAAEYRKNVGGLYDSGRGIWCQDLIKFSELMKVAVHALLDEQPLVETLRIYQATGNAPLGRILTP